MPYTFLQAVNSVLKRTKDIAGSAGELTTFTDSSRQEVVDVTIDLWNEAIRALFDLGAFPQEVSEGTITLVDGTTSYAEPSDFEGMAGETWDTRVLKNTAKNHAIKEYPGGYPAFYADIIDIADRTGQPNHWVINPINGNFDIDSTPTASEDGDAYTFLYEKRINLSTTTATFPFSDSVVDELVPVVAELIRAWRDGRPREQVASFKGFLVALRLCKQTKNFGKYGLRRLTAAQTQYFRESI